jgi:hypothetical protein
MNRYLVKIAEQSHMAKKPKKYSHAKDSANATILLDHINKHYEGNGKGKKKGKKAFAVGVGKDLLVHHAKKSYNT